MVRAYSQEHTYKHPWERVTSASWRKFADPENKRTLSHILEVDTLSRKLEPSSGKLCTTRAITVHAPGPWFLRKIIGQDMCHCVESTVVDAQSRSMQLATRNISLRKFIEVEEKIKYDPHPDNPNGWTICRQETSIRIKPCQHWHQWQKRLSRNAWISFNAIVLRGERLWRGCVSILKLNPGEYLPSIDFLS